MILVTGASGYIGRVLVPALAEHSTVVTAGRNSMPGIAHRYLDFASAQGYRDAVTGAQTIIHLGGLAHNQGDAASYEQINVRASMALADAALAAGVQRFIFVSSLNVVPANADDPLAGAATLPSPHSTYAASKWRAEQALANLLDHTSCALDIVRPALVYDRELTANLAELARLAHKLPVALPNAGIRSMVARPDLVALLVALATSERPDGASLAGSRQGVAKVFIATDGQRYNAKRIGRALGSRSALQVPLALWKLAAAVRDRGADLPKGATWQSLAAEYWVGRRPEIVGWQPAFTLESLMATSLVPASPEEGAL